MDPFLPAVGELSGRITPSFSSFLSSTLTEVIPATFVTVRGPAGVLPVSTAHRGDVRCGGRTHGRAPTQSRRATGVHDGVQAGDGPTGCGGREDGGGAQSRAGHRAERDPQLEAVCRGGRDDGGAGQ